MLNSAADWDYRNQCTDSMTPSQTRKGVDSLDRQQDNRTDPTRSHVSSVISLKLIALKTKISRKWFNVETEMLNKANHGWSVMNFRSQQPRWRFIRRRTMLRNRHARRRQLSNTHWERDWTTRIRAALYPPQLRAHGVRPATPAATAVCEVKIGVMRFKEVTVQVFF